ncbi:MAG: hypothetical protein R3324_01555 [Halobacteriales archaeon]|nr:hypothetical protein [Halobacteriales archaeon]
MNVVYRHVECGANGAMYYDGPPEPPDPDRWGNTVHPFRCAACGERLWLTEGRFGGTLLPRGMEPDASVEWTVPLPE